MAANEKYIDRGESLGMSNMTLLITGMYSANTYSQLQSFAYVIFSDDITTRVPFSGVFASASDFWLKLPLIDRVVYTSADVAGADVSIVLHKAGCFYSEEDSTPYFEGYRDRYSFIDPSEGNGEQGAIHAHFFGNTATDGSGTSSSYFIGEINNIRFISG